MNCLEGWFLWKALGIFFVFRFYMAQITSNVFGAANGEGLNTNGIVPDSNVVNGGDNPLSVIKVYNTTNSSSCGVVNIIIGNLSGGSISSVLSEKLRDMLTNYVSPFLVDDISGTVQANITGDNSTTYYSTISDFGEFTPGVGTTQESWTDSELISSFALSTLGVVNRGLLLYLDNEDLKIQVAVIADQIRNELGTKLISQQSGIMLDIRTTATIDLRYVFYVEKYGPPIGGIFDPIKLAEFV